MREGECKVMALCDAEEEYAQLMTEFMKKQKNLPWELHTYTNVDKLLQSEEKGMFFLFPMNSVISCAYSSSVSHNAMTLPFPFFNTHLPETAEC